MNKEKNLLFTNILITSRILLYDHCLNKRKYVIRFYNPLSNDTNKYTDVIVSVERKKYTNNKEFFYVHYEYYPDNVLGYEEHSFMGTCYEEHKDGDIICTNPMTEIMIYYLLMDIEEVVKICGHVNPLTYKVSIMHALTNLWD